MKKLYVDGSFIQNTTGYGAVLLDDDDSIIKEWSGSVSQEKTAGTRQVAGELEGAEVGLKWCKENGINEVELYYDYEGIGAWATRKWRAKLPLTQRYRDLVQNISTFITIHWKKIDGHSGIQWNDHVDILAKQGARNGKVLLRPENSKERPSKRLEVEAKQ